MPDQSGIEAIVFDLGGVLLELDFGRVFAAWAKHAGVSPAQIRAGYRFDAAYERHERGEITAREYFASLRESLGLALTDAQFEAGWNEVVRGEIPGVAELIARAAPRVPLYVFSNTNAMHYAHWRPGHARLLQSFRRLFLSFEMGLRKPEARAFEHLAAEIGVPFARILFFDDTAENVLAARALGMQAVQVRGTHDVREALAKI